jgi:hypothetical protein
MNQPVAQSAAIRPNHRATTVVVFGLIARSFGLAAGVGLAILLASALFSG